MNDAYRKYKHSRRTGYNQNLYRNVKRKKIGGVAAGLGDHFDIDPNIMRIAFFGAFIFTGMLAVWAYIGAWILLAPRLPEGSDDSYEYDESERCYRKKKVFRYQRSSSDRLKDASKRMQDVLARVERMERYVTSKRFDLDKKFADL